MIVYKVDVFQLLSKHGYSQSCLKREKIFSGNTIDVIRKQKPITFQTLDTICRLCSCNVSDLIEYVEDVPQPERIPEQEQEKETD